MNASAKPATKFQMFNADARKYEDVDIDDAEILPGQTVMKVFWCNSAQKYVTIPGDCIYRMNSSYVFEVQS